ncbi:MAG: ribulose-phosphate 3-epimerase [Bacteroidales bacterium]|nr:ribulose-phosphate 3-epimerase [Bacteroidales bacterium]
MALIAPSMLSADFLALRKDVEMVNRHGDLFHLDIMDGSFVPNLSYGFPVVEAIAKIAEKPVDVHLMIVNPEKYAGRFMDCGAGMVSFHVNATDNPGSLLGFIRSKGVKAGLALNPDIPLESVYPFLKECDFVLVMSVMAGFGGQSFYDSTYDRLDALKAEMARQGVECSIEVDGGVSPANAAKLVEHGADILVAGSAVFKAADPGEVIRRMR